MPRVIDAFTQFFDDNGAPLVNGFLAFKESGTNNTDKNTYADINETIANANPLQLDGAGRCPNVFGTGTYNVISYAEDANNPGNPGQQIQQFDPVNIAESEGQLSDWDSATTYNIGDLVIASDGGYYRSLTNNNENQDPTVSAGQWEEIKVIGVWNINVTYDSGDSVYGSDGILYTSLTASNIGNNPTTDTTNWKSYMDNNSPNVLDNVGFTATVATKALTFALKTRNLIDPTSTDKVRVAFRSETLTTGDYDIVEVGAAQSIIVPDGATLGFGASETGYIYFYEINNAGAAEAAVSSTLLDDSILHTTVAIDATADSKTVLYSATLRSNVPIRMVGRIKIQTGAVAGEWDNDPTELFVGERDLDTINSGTPIATTSGTSHDFTSIPSWVKKITVMIAGVSTNGTSDITLQIGDSGGIETSGYLGATANHTGAIVQNYSSGFDVTASIDATSIIHGKLEIALLDSSTNTWTYSSRVGLSNVASEQGGGGSKALSATLDRIRLTTLGGTDAFDAGSINILYE